MGGYITIEYLYRDADNYKRYNTKAFGNPSDIDPESIRHAFALAFRRLQLFPDVLSFDPALLGWEQLFFEDHDMEARDISWHEVCHIGSTQESINTGRDVDNLLWCLARLSEVLDGSA